MYPKYHSNLTEAGFYPLRLHGWKKENYPQ